MGAIPDVVCFDEPAVIKWPRYCAGELSAEAGRIAPDSPLLHAQSIRGRRSAGAALAGRR
jgi:hypothetical protein